VTIAFHHKPVEPCTGKFKKYYAEL